ncbi:Chaperone protein IpgC [Escherichia coli]|nr:Chaperone protein IpgC [Escherichia coli]
MESANLDLEENKEIASKFERALGMGATLAELHGITPDTPEGVYAYAYNFYEKGRLDEAELFLNFSVFMISKIITT